MAYTPKPMTFGEILDGAFKIFREHLDIFIPLSLLFGGLPAAVSAAIQHVIMGGSAVPSPTQALSAMAFGMPIQSIGATCLGIGSTVATIKLLNGEKYELGMLGGDLGKYFGPAFIASIIVGIMSVLGCMLLLVPGILYFSRRILNIQVAVIENTGGGASVERAAKLGTGRRGRLFGIFFVVSIILVALAQGLLVFLPESVKAIYFMKIFIQGIPGSFLGALAPIALTLAYYDARVRDEALDVEQQAGKYIGAT